MKIGYLRIWINILKKKGEVKPMALSKLVKINNQWKRISLDQEEMNVVMQNLVELNGNEFRRCMEMANKISEKKDDIQAVTMALFDKQGIASFTAISEALEEKVNNIRDNAYQKPNIIQSAEERKPVPEAPKPEREETPQEVSDDIFGKEWNPTEKKFVKEGEDDF
jgi:hypothetical protein